MANVFPEFDRVLLDLCQVGARAPNEGNDRTACSQLIRDVSTHGRAHLVEQYTQSPGTNEYRLNGDRPKLQYEVEFYRDGEGTNAYVVNFRIGGDQVEEYPEFVRAAQSILKTANGLTSSVDPFRHAG